MSNPVRLCLPNVTYHCYSRCIEKRNMLSPRHVKELASEAIIMALEKYNFQLVQMEFVENHFHLMIKTVENGQTIVSVKLTGNFNSISS